MLSVLAVLLAVMWLIGLMAGVVNGAIHLLIVAALALLLYDLTMGRRRAHLR